ncbi:MAG: hypothetical protein AAF907_09740, partial [Planctomycetota bacterium]
MTARRADAYGAFMDGISAGTGLRDAGERRFVGRSLRVVIGLWFCLAIGPVCGQDGSPASADPPADAAKDGPHPLAGGEEDAPRAGTDSPENPQTGADAESEEPSPPADPALPTAEQIAAKAAAVKAAGAVEPPTDGLTPEQRTAVLADLAAAADARKRLEAMKTDRAGAEAAAEAVQKVAERLQKELADLPPVPKVEEVRQTFAGLPDPAVVTEGTKAENDQARLTREKESLTQSLSAERRETERAALQAALKSATEAAATAETPDPALPIDVATARIARRRLEKAVAAEALAAADAEAVRAAAAAAVGVPALRKALLERRLGIAAVRSKAADEELNQRASAKVRDLVADATGGEIPAPLQALSEEVAALQDEYNAQAYKRNSAQKLTEKTQRE